MPTTYRTQFSSFLQRCQSSGFFQLLFSCLSLCLFALCIGQTGPSLGQHFQFIFIHILGIWSRRFCFWIWINFTWLQFAWIVNNIIAFFFALCLIPRIFTMILCLIHFITFKYICQIYLRI